MWVLGRYKRPLLLPVNRQNYILLKINDILENLLLQKTVHSDLAMRSAEAEFLDVILQV
jgi:hypothetical protein